MRIPWTEDEAVVLVDAFYRVQNGELSMRAAIKETSQFLRHMATNKGITIDDKYRNENGVGMQMQIVKQTVEKDKSGFMHGSKLFSEMIDLRTNDRKAYDSMLDSAKANAAMSLSITQKTALTADSSFQGRVTNKGAEEDGNILCPTSRESFSSWIIENVPNGAQNRTEQAFTMLSMLCRKTHIAEKPLSSINDVDELIRIKQIISSNKILKIGNRKLLSDFTRVISLYGEYISDAPSFIPFDRPHAGDPLLEEIRGILLEGFKNTGIRPASTIHRSKLERAYATKYGKDLPNGIDLPAILADAGVLHGDKVYVFTAAQEECIRDTVQQLFSEGHHVVYYSELLTHQAALLEECGLYDVPLLRAVLKHLLPGAVYEDSYMLSGKGASRIESIVHAFGNDIKLNYTQIKERCPYLSLDAIKGLLSASDRFVWTANETFVQTDMIRLAQDEVDQIKSIVLPKLQEEGCISLYWLPIRESCELNPDVSETAVRDALYIRYMSPFCSRNGLIVTPKGSTISSYDLMVTYCQSLAEVTLSELEAYEQVLTGRNTSLMLRAACNNMVRIDHDHFVSDQRITFDVNAIDRAIGLFVNGRIAPITAIISFTSFPDVDGYEWNLYLVESFLRRFSLLFAIVGGPAHSSFMGAIYPKTMRFESQEVCLAAAVIQDNVPLNTENIGRYLIDHKYILRRSAAVKTVFEKALRIEEQRGTPHV